MRNKKADISGMKFILYMCYAFVISIGFVLFVGTLSSISNRSAVVPDGLETKLIMQRVLSSPNCFAYQDYTGRSYDIVDIQKFNNEVLEKCLILDRFPYAFKFDLDFWEAGIIREHLAGDYIEFEGRVQSFYSANTTGWFGHHFIDQLYLPVIVMKNDIYHHAILTVSRQQSSRSYG